MSLSDDVSCQTLHQLLYSACSGASSDDEIGYAATNTLM